MEERNVKIEPAAVMQALARRAQTDPLIAAVLDAAMWEAAFNAANTIPEPGNDTLEPDNG